MSASRARLRRAVGSLPLGRRKAVWPLLGPRSIFAKGLRDSRRAILLAGIGIGLLAVTAAASTAAYYPTVASRVQSVRVVAASTAGFGAIYGPAINIERLGGLVVWNCASLVTIMFALWSIVALSGTLAGEDRSGSLEMLAGVAISRRRIACQKLLVHVVGLVLAILIVAVFTWLTGILWAVLPGDGMAFSDALAEFAGLALLGLVGGAVAFALAPFLGRGPSAGVGAVAFFGAFFVNAYSGLVPAFGSIRSLSWFSWTTRQHPLAGSWDLVSLFPVVGLIAALLAAGVLAFERRDLGSAALLPRLSLPGRNLLLRSLGGRAFLGLRSAALTWGLGLGTLTGAIALSSQSLITATAADRGSAQFVDQMFGGGWTSTSGLLQITFTWLGYLLMALAGATFLGTLASDERERRLDLILSTPVSRTRWLVGGGLGVYAAIALLSFVVGLMTALGAVGTGEGAVGPLLGALVGGLYTAALVGLGLAVLGLGRAELAGVVASAAAIGMYVWDWAANLVWLPPQLVALLLTRHLGSPMTGTYDWPGMALLVALAVGGLAVGAWGIRRRDVTV